MSTYLGHKLRIARNKLGLTQQQLADKVNTSASTIWMYEQGRRESCCKMLVQLSEILNFSVNEASDTYSG